MKFPNRVREARGERGYSRDELAKLVGLTRQSVGLIETGRVCPSTLVALRMSRVLECAVEDLFWEPVTTVQATFLEEGTTNIKSPIRAYVSSIRDEIIARPAQIGTVDSINNPVNGLVHTVSTNGSSEVQLLHAFDSLSRTVFVSGCDIGLGLLAKYTQKISSQHQGVWFNASNKHALMELKKGFTHIAAVHFRHAGGDHPDCELPFSCRQFHFATAQLGWILPKGNPKKFHGAGDLADGRFRLINRDVGAGARELLDRELKNADVKPDDLPGYTSIAKGHISVADAVANGIADVGVGHAGAATVYGLAFVPIQQEVCTLIVPEQYLKLEAVQVFLETLHSDVFRTELNAFGPYDLQRMGSMIS